jgi:hypothetical protein
MKYSFEVYLDNNLVFFSNKNWIHPLFEFEKFIRNTDFPLENLLVKDKIVGKAAAMLLIHFKIKKIHAKTLSRLGQEILDLYEISHSFDKLIDKVYCQTEILLSDITDTQIAYNLLKERAETTDKAM